MAALSVDHGEVPPLELWKLILATFVLGGIQFGWALQLSLLTPYVQDLGIPSHYATLIWLCGPIAGLFVQPLVGWYSDKCRNKYGRRRPYIVVGAFLVIFSMLMISNASTIGHALGDPVSGQEANECANIDPSHPPAPIKHVARPIAIAFFVIGFWILDISNNMMQGPCRALLADIAAPEQQYIGMALVSLWIGAGNVLGYMAGWVEWSKYLPFMVSPGCNDNCANLRSAFVLAMLSVMSSTAVTCFVAKEKQFTDEEEVGKNPFKEVFEACKTLDRPMYWVCAVMFCNWIGLYPFFVFQTDWWGKTIYHGSPSSGNLVEHCDYNAGVRKGSLALVFNSIVALLASFIAPRVVDKVGPKRTWSFGLGLFAVLMICTTFTTSKAGAFAIYAILGIPWAITLVVPFGVVSMIAGDQSAGLLMGVLNIAVVVPQLVVTGFNVPFQLIPGVSSMGDSASFLAAGLVSAIGAVIALYIPLPRAVHDEFVDPTVAVEEADYKRF